MKTENENGDILDGMLQTLDESWDRVATAPKILPLHRINSLDGYLGNYGKALGKKAITSLMPLHVPNVDEVPDFDEVPAHRQPFPAQADVVAAGIKMLNETGSGFICGEMGTGKTILSILTTHKHAQLSRKKGGYGGNYRALVLCPDHLISKWCREIAETIPGASITRFGPQGMAEVITKGKRRSKSDEPVETNSKATLRDVIALADKRERASTGGPSYESEWYEVLHGAKWAKAEGAEWFVLGRNQAKWLSDWAGMADEKGTRKHALSTRHMIVDRTPVLNEYGRQAYNNFGSPVMKNVVARVHYCPKCGEVIRDKKGAPMSAKELSSGSSVAQKTCQGRFLRAVAPPPEKKESGIDWIPIPRNRDTSSWEPGKKVTHKGHEYVVTACNEPLYNYTSKPYRWSPARIIHKKLRRFFSYLTIDEVHEQKSDESAQSMACGKLIASVDHVLALTGTIIGGYADHLYPLLMRLNPRTLRERGYEWGKSLEFSKAYGKIEKITTITEQADEGPSVRGKVKSVRRARGGSKTERTCVRPGIMPTLFGEHMIGCSMFITLDSMSSDLPDLFEYVGGALLEESPEMSESDKEHWKRMADGYFDCAVYMAPEQEREYQRVMSLLEFANKELLRRGSMKLLGTFLWTGLDYPDRPFGWGHDPDVLKALNKADDKVPALLGQAFLSNFDHKFEADTGTLVLSQTIDGETETDRVPLRKDCGVYYIDVTFNGRHTRPMIYDTGASRVSMSAAMASDIGVKVGASAQTVHSQIADGSIVENKLVKIASVKVGMFTIRDVECVVKAGSKQPHTVGYWDKPRDRTIANWVGVVTPADCDESQVFPKEQRLVDICLKQKADGRQTWVYVQMSGKRNIQPRLQKMLEAVGLKVGVLRSTDVEPIEREDWIKAHGRDYDVMISHPQLVSTGLDLFVKTQGGHNYSTLVFYETGYNLFTMRQAARRAWRIGQPLDCRVYYLYYRETMQHKAMQLMSKKMSAAQALEGEFSEEGLAAMAGDDNLQMAMAKNLAERIDESDIQRGWAKVKSGPKKTKKPHPTPLLDIAKDAAKSPLDDLPIELQMVGETMIEDAKKPVPPEALEDFPRLAEEIARHDHGSGAEEASQEFARHDKDEMESGDEEPPATIPIRPNIEFDENWDDEPVAVEPPKPVELSEDVLAKMFKNLMAHGLKL